MRFALWCYVRYFKLYNNTTNNAIVNAVFYISYRPQLQADVFAVLFMNELKSLTNIVVGKLDKLGLHRSTSAEKEKRYIKYGTLLLIQWFLVHILIHVPVHCRHCFYCNSNAKPHILHVVFEFSIDTPFFISFIYWCDCNCKVNISLNDHSNVCMMLICYHSKDKIY